MAYSDLMSTTNQYIVYNIECYENGTDINRNTSNVTVIVDCWRTNSGYQTKGSGTCYCRINGTLHSAGINSSQVITENGVHLFEITLDIEHDSDGTKTLDISAWIEHSQFSSSEQYWSTPLSTIPRYAEINDFHVQSVGLDTVTLYYNVSRTAHIYCSVDGQLWGGPRVTNTIRGTFTISGLTPNKQHSFAILSRAVDSGLDRISPTNYATTQDLGKISVLNNFEHGDNIKLTTTNPSRF